MNLIAIAAMAVLATTACASAAAQSRVEPPCGAYVASDGSWLQLNSEAKDDGTLTLTYYRIGQDNPDYCTITRETKDAVKGTMTCTFSGAKAAADLNDLDNELKVGDQLFVYGKKDCPPAQPIKLPCNVYASPEAAYLQIAGEYRGGRKDFIYAPEDGHGAYICLFTPSVTDPSVGTMLCPAKGWQKPAELIGTDKIKFRDEIFTYTRPCNGS